MLLLLLMLLMWLSLLLLPMLLSPLWRHCCCRCRYRSLFEEDDGSFSYDSGSDGYPMVTGYDSSLMEYEAASTVRVHALLVALDDKVWVLASLLSYLVFVGLRCCCPYNSTV